MYQYIVNKLLFLTIWVIFAANNNNMNRKTLLLMMMLAFFTNMMASVCAGENVVVMTEWTTPEAITEIPTKDLVELSMHTSMVDFWILVRTIPEMQYHSI